MSGRPESPAILKEISMRWPLITDPLQFVLRYAPAVRRYLAALVKDPHDAEDVAQNFLMRAVARPFTPDQVRRGRFRDYLKAVLRNEAVTHLRRRGRRPNESAELHLVPVPGAEDEAEAVWRAEWRECLLKRAWDGLERHEREAPDGLACTVLRLAADHPGEDSTALAALASARAGRSIRADAYRKQLSRARRRFAQLLVNEVRQTLEHPQASAVVEELSDLGLLDYVRDFLPPHYRG